MFTLHTHPRVVAFRAWFANICAVAFLASAPGVQAQVDGLGLTWETLSQFSGTSSPSSQMRSSRSVTVSPDEQTVFVGFIQGTSSSGLRKIDATTGAILQTATIANSRQPKAGACDDRGYVYFGASHPSGDGQFRIYDSNLALLNTITPSGTQRIGGMSLRKVGSTYLLYIAREASSSALIERYDVTDVMNVTLDVSFASGGQFNVRSFVPTALNLSGLEVESDGTIYQTDRDLNAIFRIPPTLDSLTTATLDRPIDVGVRSNRLYVTQYDGTNSYISVFRKTDLANLCKLTTGIARENVTDSGYAGIDIPVSGRIYMADQFFANTPSTVFQDRIVRSSVLPDEPAITLQPDDLFLLTGEGLTNTVAATGTALLSYQWYRDSNPIIGVTTAEIIINNVITNDDGNYIVTVSNIAGVATSSVAVVTVIEPVSVIASPASSTNLVGDDYTFSVGLGGSSPFNYQWYFDNAIITDATNATLVMTDLQLPDDGEYFVVVSNAGGNATSDVATLTVVLDITQPPSLLQPAENSTTGGTNVTVEFSLPEEALANSVQLLFDSANDGLDRTFVLADVFETSGSHLLSFDTGNPMASSHFDSVYVNNLSSGSYTVILSYQDALSHDAATATQLNVLVDAVTDSPVLTQPASDAVNHTNVNVQFSLPENALAGTVQLIFDSTNNALDRTFTLDAALEVSGSHSFSFNVADPLDSAEIQGASINNLPGGSYDVAVVYQDALANPAAADSATNVIIDVTTATPTLLTPASGSTSGHNVTVSYVLPDAPLANSVTLFFDSTNNAWDRVFTLAGSMEVSGSNGFTFALDNPLGSAAIASSTPANSLSNGTYAVALTYQDSLGNPIASTTNLNVRFILDTNLPTVTVTAPKLSRVYSNALPTFSIFGNAKDNFQVTNVQYDFNGLGYTAAQLSSFGKITNWNAEVQMKPGTNTVWVRAHDLVGNVSKTTKLTFYWYVPSTFVLETNGVGKVDSVNAGLVLGMPTNGAILHVGRTYKLITSVISNDWRLTNITYTAANDETGTLFTNTAAALRHTLAFTMRTNMVITANFVTNPLVRFAGSYNGLFFEPDMVRHHSAGFARIAVTRGFGCTGTLMVDGNSVGFSGRLALDGTLNKTISRSKLNKSDLQLSVTMNFAGATEELTGFVSGTNLAGEEFTASLRANRTVWTTNVGQEALQFTNRYTMIVTGLTSNADGPEGFGYALINLTSTKGRIGVSGHLSDSFKNQVPIAQNAVVSTNGEWPFFSAMYTTTNRLVTNGLIVKPVKEKQGMIMGWLTFTNSNTPHLAPEGPVTWIKTSWTNDSWAGGFTNEVWVLGSRHLPPEMGSTNRIYNFTNAWVTLEGGQLSSAVSNVVNLKTNNMFFVDLKNIENPVTHKFRASLARGTGLISGTFTNNAASGTTNINWRGVMLQDQNIGLGFFVDYLPATNSSGKVLVTPKD